MTIKLSRKAMFGWIVGAVLVVGGAAIAATITIILSGAFGSGVSNTPGACDTSLTFSFPAPSYSSSVMDYAFTTIDYDGLNVNMCDTQTLRVTVIDSANNALGNATLLIDDTPSAGTPTPSSGTLSLSQPVQVSQVVRVVSAITNN